MFDSAWAELTRRLVTDICALNDVALREIRLVTFLANMETIEIVEVLHEVLERADAKDSNCQELLLSLVNLGRHQETLGYDCLAEIYNVANDRGYEGVKHLVSTQQAAKQMPKGTIENEYLEEKTLGERKAFAYTQDRDLLDRLLFDLNPQVINKVLENPRLTERDVIKVASMRPTSVGVITEIVNSHKWVSRYLVKKTIICNPYSPVNIALSLLSYMMVSDLREISRDTNLANEVRQEARRRATQEALVTNA